MSVKQKLKALEAKILARREAAELAGRDPLELGVMAMREAGVSLEDPLVTYRREHPEAKADGAGG
jgi:hypothetical protein